MHQILAWLHYIGIFDDVMVPQYLGLLNYFKNFDDVTVPQYQIFEIGQF